MEAGLVGKVKVAIGYVFSRLLIILWHSILARSFAFAQSFYIEEIAKTDIYFIYRLDAIETFHRHINSLYDRLAPTVNEYDFPYAVVATSIPFDISMKHFVGVKFWIVIFVCIS
jgi:hypothetical protein